MRAVLTVASMALSITIPTRGAPTGHSVLSQAPHFVLLSALGLSCSAILASDAINAQRQQELEYLLHQNCGSCHGMTLKGGLGPSLLPAALAGKPDDYLRHVIAKGVPGKAMPPWENILELAEIDFLVEYLRGPENASGLNP